MWGRRERGKAGDTIDGDGSGEIEGGLGAGQAGDGSERAGAHVAGRRGWESQGDGFAVADEDEVVDGVGVSLG
jgi:hypothetical protein